MKSYFDYINFLKENNIYEISLGRKMPPESYEKIRALIEKYKLVKILEIGTNHGHCTCFLRFLNESLEIVTIDIKRYENFNKIIKFFPSDKTNILIGDSQKELPKIKTIFDLVIIDGNHNYSACLQDYNNIKKNIKKGSIVVFDDLDCKEGCGKVFYDIDEFEKEEYIENGRPYLGIVYV